MFSLILLLGSVFIFANPNLGDPTAVADYGYYGISDRLPANGTRSSLDVSGAYGAGIGFQSYYLDQSPWRHSLNLRYYEGDGYDITMTSLGFDYTTTVPNSPIRLGVGVEAGAGQFSAHGYSSVLDSRETFGWEVHTEVSNYFVSQGYVWNLYIRPAFRFYEYPLDGRGGYPDQQINGTAPALTAGVGLEF
jgi:hypothetical protein